MKNNSTHSNTERKKEAKKETRVQSIRVPSTEKDKIKNMSEGEYKQAMDKLKEVYALLSDGEYITTTTLQIENELKHISCKIQQVKREIDGLTQELHDLKQILQEYESTKTDLTETLQEERAKEIQRKNELNECSERIVVQHLRDKDTLLCQEIMEEYLDVYTNKECIHSLRNFVKYHVGRKINVDGKDIVIDKTLKRSLLNLADSLEC